MVHLHPCSERTPLTTRTQRSQRALCPQRGCMISCKSSRALYMRRRKLYSSRRNLTTLKWLQIKTSLFGEMMQFQQQKRRPWSAHEIALDWWWCQWDSDFESLLTEEAELDALLDRTLLVHELWVVAFVSLQISKLLAILEADNDSKIDNVESKYDHKYYWGFQLALDSRSRLCLSAGWYDTQEKGPQPQEPRTTVIQYWATSAVFCHWGRRISAFSVTEKKRVCTCQTQVVIVERIVKVDFLSSSWFRPAELVKSIFIKTPSTFSSVEDLHLSCQVQKYHGHAFYVVRVDPKDIQTWEDKEHHLAQVSATTVIHQKTVEVQDNQWWQYFLRG